MSAGEEVYRSYRIYLKLNLHRFKFRQIQEWNAGHASLFETGVFGALGWFFIDCIHESCDHLKQCNLLGARLAYCQLWSGSVKRPAWIRNPDLLLWKFGVFTKKREARKVQNKRGCRPAAEAVAAERLRTRFAHYNHIRLISQKSCFSGKQQSVVYVNQM